MRSGIHQETDTKDNGEKDLVVNLPCSKRVIMNNEIIPDPKSGYTLEIETNDQSIS